jgi:bacillithiol biosynthesis deacetylase BshB1
MRRRRKRFLVVSPHPDDAELGIGGTICTLKNAGHKVFVVDMTDGEPTPFGTRRKRKRESERASGILGLDTRITLGFPNRYLFDSREARLALAEKIRLLRPDIILSPSHEDAHPDHTATARITEGARFYAKFSKITLQGKPHYAPYLLYYFCSHLRIQPAFSFLIDISKAFPKKLRALRCYRSQFLDNPKNRFVFQYIESQNRSLGMLIHAKYAEAVFCREAIKLNDLALIL